MRLRFGAAEGRPLRFRRQPKRDVEGVTDGLGAPRAREGIGVDLNGELPRRLLLRLGRELRGRN